jgi:16S rRNA (adenine1518-N6/adenine1519-N6)-dimethyltransferase
MDGGAAHKIARLSLQGATNHPRIIEIGGGTGALTKALLDEGADVTVIEVDPDLVAILQSRDDLSASHIVHADALEFDFAEYAKGGAWHVSANLPYNVATPLMVNLVEMENGPQSLTVMIQKDVADRLAAKPSTPAYGSLSLAIQYAMTVERAFTLGPRVFYPPPNVDSTVVRLVRRPQPVVQPVDLALFRKVVRAAFAYRRKTLANSLVLALGIDRARVTDAIAASSLPPESRGEQLDINAFCRLADNLAER